MFENTDGRMDANRRTTDPWLYYESSAEES